MNPWWLLAAYVGGGLTVVVAGWLALSLQGKREGLEEQD